MEVSIPPGKRGLGSEYVQFDSTKNTNGMIHMKLDKKVRDLITDNCVNYYQGECLVHECNCVQKNSMESLMEGKVICKYFREAVLPIDKLLMEKIAGVNIGKRCKSCKKVFMPTGNRQIYCHGCADMVKKQQAAVRYRKLYWREKAFKANALDRKIPA